MSKLIGVTAGEIVNKDRAWAPVTYGQSHMYTDSIVDAGGIPIIIPLTDNKQTLRKIYESLDGILFTGGNDIDPSLYGQDPSTNTLVDVSPFRDQNEAQLMKWALEDNKPILCICRGMELLNVVNGGTLFQDIASQLEGKQDHDRSTKAEDVEDLAHTLRIEPSSKLADILEAESIQTNTHHHQAVDKVADGYIVSATAEDGIIEGIEPVGDFTYVIGVQSHPESLQRSAQKQWQKLFSSFVQAVNATNRK